MRRLLISLTGFFCLVSCGASEESIRAELANANSCTQATDCANVGDYCPYGCNLLVNASQADRIRSLLESNVNNTCAYDCAGLSWISCDSGACVGHFE